MVIGAPLSLGAALGGIAEAVEVGQLALDRPAQRGTELGAGRIAKSGVEETGGGTRRGLPFARQALHAGELKIDCMYCHSGAERSRQLADVVREVEAVCRRSGLSRRAYELLVPYRVVSVRKANGYSPADNGRTVVYVGASAVIVQSMLSGSSNVAGFGGPAVITNVLRGGAGAG